MDGWVELIEFSEGDGLNHQDRLDRWNSLSRIDWINELCLVDLMESLDG